ncbi:hypothetical protein M7I_6454 [Glarea lozoyensis 74030]|uniref:Uncharacterized protein n=1 Tax=Glarea lozoyensis (strain ATCC 74030 / MF5533) TaxID=1104152 RepID=H0EUL7_GLAL7|nr:hypothetical protein M7I_6454 [Glarea lozoyensis 74030]
MPTSKRKASKSGGARRKKQNTGRQIKVEKHEEVSGDERSMRGVKKEENRKVHNVKIEKREEVPSERSGMEGVQKEEQKEEKWQQYKVEKHEVEFDEGNGEGRAHEKDDETSHTWKNILDSHNKFFKNHKVNIGDEYTNDHKSSRTRVMETRTMRAIRGKLLKWKDARKIVEDTYKEVGVRRRYWRKIDREELKAEKEKIKKNDGRNVDVREDVDDREETEDEEELDDGSETDETPERTVSEESLIGDADSEHTRYEITYGKEEVLAMLATLNARS